MFLSIEDETGIANAVVMPDLFETQRLMLATEPWLLVEGKIQNVDNVIHVLAQRVERLPTASAAAPAQHNFH